MNNKLYVGNLPFSITEDGLEDLFSQFGSVQSAKVITDRETGRSKGFGFVEMGTPEEAQQAIENLDGSDYEGRPMRVNEAKPQEPRRGGGGGGGGGYRGGGGGGRGGGHRGGGGGYRGGRD